MTERREKDADLRKDAPKESREKDKDREDAPETETPESPKVVARVAEKVPEKTSARNAPLETPEKPAQPPLRQKKELEVVRSVTVAAPTRAYAPVLPVVDEVTELQRHVAQCPVDAHAPAWVGRAPNSL